MSENVKGLLGLESARRGEIEAARLAEAARQAEEAAEIGRVLEQVVYPSVVQALVEETGLAAAAFEGVLSVNPAGSWLNAGNPYWWYVTASLDLPEHNLVWGEFVWVNEKERYLRRSSRWEVQGYSREERMRWPESVDLMELGNALVLARELWEQEVRRAEEEAKWEARRVKVEAERAEKERVEWDALAKLVVSDPVAMGLVRLFQVVQRERDGVAEQVENLEYVLEKAEAVTERRVVDLEREVEAARAEAADYQRRAREA